MFNFIRKHQRLMLLVILILILPSFVLIGVSGYSSYNSGDDELVTVGDQAVTAQEYDMARRNQLNTLQRTMGSAFDVALFETPEARQQLLDSLVNRRVLIEIATKDRFSISDTALRQAIAATPELQENGTFSPQLYTTLLAQQGISIKDFEQSQRAELALDRVIQPVMQTAVLPEFVRAELEKILLETRLIQTYEVQAQDLLAQQQVSTDEVQAWYEANQDALRLPDYVNVDYVLLDQDAAVSSVPSVSDEDLQTYYQQNQSRFVTPARVHLSHILLQTGGSNDAQTVLQQAKELAAQVRADPSLFAELAKQHSQDGGSAASGGELGWITEGTWPDALQKAVFSLNEGEVSEVIDGPDGYHVFKANAFEPEQSQPFESVKAELAEEVRQQLAAEKFAEMATQLTQLVYDSPESLDAAADALGVQLLQAQGLTRERLLSADELGLDVPVAEQAQLLTDPRVRRALYSAQSLQDQHNAGVIEIASDTLVAVRVSEFVPSHVPPLDQVQDQVSAYLQQEKAVTAAHELGQAQLQQLQAGEAVAVSFSPEQSVSRIDPGSLFAGSLEALMAVDADQLPAYVGVDLPNGYQLIKVVAAEQTEANPMLVTAIQTQLQQIWSNAQEQVFMAALREQLHVKQLPAAEAVLVADSED